MTTAVYIGRFQPFHNGHVEVLSRALQKYDNVLVLIGTAQAPSTIKNPWDEAERASIIWDWFISGTKTLGRLAIQSIRDYPYNNYEWKDEVLSKLDGNLTPEDVVLVGGNPDDSEFYSGLFPEFKQDLIARSLISATKIRDLYFGERVVHKCAMPQTSIDYLTAFQNSKQYERLCDEYKHIKLYKQSWSKSPYPPVFVTVDAVVTCGNHILLIQRKFPPGEGLWALPGGFINANERVKDAVIRELREETGIVITQNQLRSCGMFDHPDRSLRGRTITTAWNIHINEFIYPKAGDDAAKAMWLHKDELKGMRKSMYDDHYHITHAMLAGDLE